MITCNRLLVQTTASKHGINPHNNKCISEGLMHVPTTYHCTAGPKVNNVGNKYQMARPITLRNFIALRQKVCEIFPSKNF